MTEKELKKLSRNELLELLLQQTRRTEELEKKLEESERNLRNKTLTISNAGSIAEAALQVNGVFEAAEAAAKQYLDNIKECSVRADRMLADTEQRCAEMEKSALEKFMALKPEIDELHSKLQGFGSADLNRDDFVSE